MVAGFVHNNHCFILTSLFPGWHPIFRRLDIWQEAGVLGKASITAWFSYGFLSYPGEHCPRCHFYYVTHSSCRAAMATVIGNPWSRFSGAFISYKATCDHSIGSCDGHLCSTFKPEVWREERRLGGSKGCRNSWFCSGEARSKVWSCLDGVLTITERSSGVRCVANVWSTLNSFARGNSPPSMWLWASYNPLWWQHRMKGKVYCLESILYFLYDAYVQ